MNAPARILVVDDSLTIRKLIELSFRSVADCELVFATNGSDGIAMATSTRPDVILLDFVLPDMKGIDVCERLAADPRTADCPIVLMSGKHENVRQLFKNHASVVDFVGKPFAADDIVRRIEAARSRLPAPTTQTTIVLPVITLPPPAGAATVNAEAAAKIMYAKLRPRLGQIPEWMKQTDAGSTALFLARKLLTPDLVRELLDALSPLYAEALGSRQADVDSGPLLSGKLDAMSLGQLCEMIAHSRGTGEIELRYRNRRSILFVRDGVIVLATTCEPDHYLADAGVLLTGIAAPALGRAEAEQIASGKPVLISLAESGLLSTSDLAAAALRASKAVVRRALDDRDGQFAWHARPALPLYVEAYGRPVSLSQLRLETLRRATTRAPSVSIDTIYERAPNFSHKVRELELTDEEQKVLTVIDGREAIRSVSARTSVRADELAGAIHRLAEIGLIQRSTTALAERGRPIMVLEPDSDGFSRPLARLLRNRPQPIDVLDLDAGADPVGAIARERPRLVLLNADSLGDGAHSLAREITRDQGTDDLRLVAVLECGSGADTRALIHSGFDAVITKPVHIDQIEYWLSELAVDRGGSDRFASGTTRREED